jgi:predicted transcriptional regulator
MKEVMSVRLDSEGLRRLRELSKREKKEMSAVARELMDYGWVFLMLREYREGKRSLGSFARELGVPLTEAIDLLADLGVRSPLEYDDYLRGYSAAKDFLGGKGR